MTDPQDNKAQQIAREYFNLPDADKQRFNELLLHPAELPPDPPDQWQPLTMGDVYKPLDPIRYIVNELLELGSLNILYGPPGTLKSFLIQDLAACVVTGKTWLQPAPWGNGAGRAMTTTQAPAVWLDFDMGARRTIERFAALGRHYGISNEAPLKIYSMPVPPLNAGDPVHVDLLATRASGAGLIVIDNLRTVSGGIDENSSQMSEVMFNLRWLAELTGAAVLVIHHERKSNGFAGRSGDALRGHSSIEAAIDLALRVEREPYSDLITVVSTKTRGLEVLPFSCAFTYDKSLDGALNTAAFYGVESEDNQSNYAIEREIIDALKLEPMNQSKLWGAVHEVLPDVGKNRIIDQIKRLVSSDKISVKTGNQNAKIYSLPVSRSLPEFPGKLD
jgi:hypothetical protein